MKTSLIITTYNRPDALALVLDSVLKQTQYPDEVLIGDDGSTVETRLLIDRYKEIFPIPLIHVWQEDKGFRLSRIKNKCFERASGDYFVVIDGDIVLHKDYIKSHLYFAEKNYFLQGHRVMLGKTLTEKAIKNGITKFSFFQKDLKNRKNTIHNLFLAKLFSPRSVNMNGIKGGIMSLWKEDVFNVNGYNEDFESWGKEDSEFGLRLLNSGVKGRDLRFCAVTYHLDHGQNSKKKYSDGLKKNLSILQNTKEQKLIKCKNGIIKF